jgi:hypothetical protein
MFRFLSMLLGIVIGVAIGIAFASGFDEWRRGRASVPLHPQIAFLEQAVAAKPGEADFTLLNDGYWAWLCLIGPVTDVVAAMEQEAGRRGGLLVLDKETRARFPAPLGRDEGALGVVDDLGVVSLVRFPLAVVTIPAATRCTDRENPVVRLAAG